MNTTKKIGELRKRERESIIITIIIVVVVHYYRNYSSFLFSNLGVE